MPKAQNPKQFDLKGIAFGIFAILSLFRISIVDSYASKSENLSLENYLIKVPSPFEGRRSG